MKVFTHRYESHEHLISYIHEHQLTDHSAVLTFYFSGITDLNVNQEIINLLNSHLSNNVLVGSSTAGEIINGSISEASLLLTFILMEETRLSVKILPLDNDQIELGRTLGRISHSIDAKLTLLFSDGLRTNGDHIVKGFSEVAPHIPLSGAKSGDNGLFYETYLFSNDGIHTNSLLSVFFIGESLRVTIHQRLGWTPLGPTFKVSLAENHYIKKLDLSTTAEIYRKYLGKSNFFAPDFTALSAFPLLFEDNGLTIARTPIATHHNGTFEFAGSIQTNTPVQLGIGDVGTLLQENLALSNEIINESPEVALLFSCSGRKSFLGCLAAHEFASFPKTIPHVGFYAYGEFYYDQNYSHHYFLNSSLVAITFSEKSIQQQKRFNQSINDFNSSLNRDFPFLNVSSAVFHLCETLSNEIATHHPLDDCYPQKLSPEISSESRFKIMNEMLCMIAHQWRQPLMKSNMIASSLLHKSQNNMLNSTKLHSDIELLNTQLEDLSEVINKITEWFQHDKVPTTVSWHEIAHCIQELIDYKISESKINLSIDIQQEVQLHTYKNDILQVLLLLINNSIENIVFQNLSKGNIHISCGFNLKSNKAYIILQDDGGGIPEQNFHKVFEPYFSTKEESNGVGLGLFIVKTIIEKHLLGEINISNTHEGVYILIEFVSKLGNGQHIS